MKKLLSLLAFCAFSLSAQLTTIPSSGGGGAPASHATQHQDGGSDEVATATPAANAIPKAEADGDLNVGWIPLDASYTWTNNHIFTPTTAVPADDPKLTGFDVGWRLRPIPVDGPGFRYSAASIALDVDDGVQNASHYGLTVDVRGGTGGTSQNVTGAWLNVINEAAGSAIQLRGITNFIDNFQADATHEDGKYIGNLLSSAGSNKSSTGMVITSTGAATAWQDGIHIYAADTHGIHLEPLLNTVTSGDAAIYIESDPILLGVATTVPTPPANQLYVYAKTGTPETLCTKDEDGTEVCLGAAGASTDRMCFDTTTAYYPVTDAGGFQWDGTELKYPVNLLAIGEEVQYAKSVTEDFVGKTPLCALTWNFASGGPTTNNVSFNCKLSCVSDGESATSQAFDTANASGDIVVPGTAGLSSTDTWSITNTDSCAKDDTLVIEFERTTPSGDSAGTDMVHVREACIRWTN